MEFGNLAEYLSALRGKPDLALIPVPLVAAHLGISPAGVTGMVKRGRLEGVRVGSGSFVSVRSLISFEAEKQEQVATVERYLRKVAERGERRVFYEPVMDEIGLDWRMPAARKRIGTILEAVSRRSAQAHPDQQLMLSVLVHRNTAGTTRASPAFFKLASSLGHEWSDQNEFVRDHTDRVLAAYGPSKRKSRVRL